MQKNTNYFKRPLLIFLLSAFASQLCYSQQTVFRLSEQGIFSKQGVDLMIYNNSFTSGGFLDDKVNGILMIQHGVRNVNGGAVRLSPTPEQWDLTPTVTDRTVNTKENSVIVCLYYKEFDFTSKIKVEVKDSGCLISVILDNPVPKQLEGKAGMNLEFLPSTYFKKTFIMDNQTGICPLIPTGPMVSDLLSAKTPQFNNLSTSENFGDTYAQTTPMISGKNLVLSPDDPKSMVTISSLTGVIELLDGRNVAPNGWLVVRELIPAGKTGNVVQWMFNPNSVSGWVKEPVISHSQAGYHPDQKKVAVIELDQQDNPLATASLLRLNIDGTQVNVLNSKLITWGEFKRYSYLKFDFSHVTESGIYKIKYGDVVTDPFPIGEKVYGNIWHPTLDIWFPVQMDHMFVK